MIYASGSTVNCITMNCVRQSLLHLLGSMLLLLLHAHPSSSVAAAPASCIRQMSHVVIGCHRLSDTFKTLRAERFFSLCSRVVQCIGFSLGCLLKLNPFFSLKLSSFWSQPSLL